jgi:hypothetical protein
MGKKYDVVISYAEEDKGVVQQITPYLRKYKLTYFDFHEELNWGKSLIGVTLEKYGQEARCVLVLVSRYYAEKYWPITELEIAQLTGKYKEVYVLPLRLDDTPMPRMPSSIIHLKWQNNPGEVASSIATILKPIKRTERIKLGLKLGILLLLLMGLAWFAILSFQDYKGSKEAGLVQPDSASVNGKKDTVVKHDTSFVEKPPADPGSATQQPGHNKPAIKSDDYTITGTVKDAATGAFLDSVLVDVLGTQVFTHKGHFVIVLHQLVDANKEYQKTLEYSYEKKGYERRSLKESVFISKDAAEHTIEATLTKQN